MVQVNLYFQWFEHGEISFVCVLTIFLFLWLICKVWWAWTFYFVTTFWCFMHLFIPFNLPYQKILIPMNHVTSYHEFSLVNWNWDISNTHMLRCQPQPQPTYQKRKIEKTLCPFECPPATCWCPIDDVL